MEIWSSALYPGRRLLLLPKSSAVYLRSCMPLWSPLKVAETIYELIAHGEEGKVREILQEPRILTKCCQGAKGEFYWEEIRKILDSL